MYYQMAMPIKCDLNFGLPVIAVLGTIYSMWATDYLIIVLRANGGFYMDMRDRQLLKPAQYTYLLLCLGTSILLYRGFQNSDKKLIKYWVMQKWIESSFVIIGFIITLSVWRMFYWNWPYLIVAAAILSFGYCLLRTVKLGYQEKGIELDSVRIPDVFTRSRKLERPPPYESAENIAIPTA